MNIVFPMAGEGRRFREAGYREPKMLIQAAGRPMLYWALASLTPYVEIDRAVFICLREHVETYPLESTIRAYCPNAGIAVLDKITGGQAQTVLAAGPLLNEEEPLLIYNCDTYMRMGRDLFSGIRGADGVIPVFRSQDPGFSYAQADETGRVLQVREKEVISEHATTGLYHFAAARLFLDAAEEAIGRRSTHNGEYYVAPLYNDLIRKGYSIRIAQVESCFPIGTPAQLQAFESAMTPPPI
jgi:dTDP-glucose pyrophosphorylase